MEAIGFKSANQNADSKLIISGVEIISPTSLNSQADEDKKISWKSTNTSAKGDPQSNPLATVSPHETLALQKESINPLVNAKLFVQNKTHSEPIDDPNSSAQRQRKTIAEDTAKVKFIKGNKFSVDVRFDDLKYLLR